MVDGVLIQGAANEGAREEQRQKEREVEFNITFVG